MSVSPLSTSAALSVIEDPLNSLLSNLSVILSYSGRPVIVTVVAVDEAGAVTLMPRPTVPPSPVTDSVGSAIVRVGDVSL